MAKRKQNPVHSSGRKFRYIKEDGIRKPPKDVRGQMNKRERKEFLKTVEYMERVEAMRPYFGDTFKAKGGYNLHEVDQWSPAMKRKVTNYFRIIAPRLEGGDFVAKRYRRPDHMHDAIAASLQEKPLKGQTAALFSVPKGTKKITVRFSKKYGAKVRRVGAFETTVLFDKSELIKDWKTELDRVLNMVPDQRLFRIIKGANQSDVIRREDLFEEIAGIIETYTQDMTREGGFDQRWFGEWLNGLVAYEGLTISQMEAQDRRRKEAVRDRELARARRRAKQTKAVPKKKLKKQLQKQRGRKLKRGELAKGRKGRVK